MPQRSVHGVNQIKAGINQRAIEIKHQQANLVRIEAAKEANHENSG
jgi:hypothetical protein